MGDWGGRWRSGCAYAKWIAIGRSRRIGWLYVANNRERLCDILGSVPQVDDDRPDRGILTSRRLRAGSSGDYQPTSRKDRS